MLQILLILFSLQELALTAEYYVRSTSSTSCAEPCQLLNVYLKSSERYFTSGSVLIFLEGEHDLNDSLVINGITGLTLRGNNAESAILNVASRSSIIFNDSQSVVISSLNITHQGAAGMPHTTLILENCTSVQVSNVKFTGVNKEEVYSQAVKMIQSTVDFDDCFFANWHSRNGAAMFTERSIITFSGSTTFANNTADKSGGGIYAGIESTVTFNGTSTFFNNNAMTFFDAPIDIGGGGGLYSNTSTILFDGLSIFTKNGPINESVELHGASLNVYRSTLTIRNNAVFSENSGSYSGAIEGMQSNISLNGSMAFKENRFGGVMALFSCRFSCSGKANFTNNEGFGFGTAVYMNNGTLSFNGEINFINNTAHGVGGGAFYTIDSSTSFQGTIKFINNSALDSSGGAFYIDNSSVEFSGGSTFERNAAEYKGGGVYILDSTIKVSGSSTISENWALDGGGLGLEGTSKLLLSSPVTVTFDRNKATERGGAILVDTSTTGQCQNTTIERRNCFFAIDTANASLSDIVLNFPLNYAGRAGSVLYGGSLQLCNVQVNGIQLQNDSFEFFHIISNIPEEQKTPLHVSSDPFKVVFCESGDPDFSNNSNTAYYVRPGQHFNISVVTVGQGNMPVPATIRAYINNDDAYTELIPQSYLLSGTCTNITFELFTNDTNKTLSLYPDGPCGNTGNTRLESEVILESCPPGFDLDGDRCKCEERLLNLNSSLKCDINTLNIQRPGNSWINPLFDNGSYVGFILYRDCPLGFCKPRNDETFLHFAPNGSDILCSANRTGQVCGACTQGTSLTLSTYRCKNCSNQFISMLLFFGFAGVALIAVLLVLHLTVAVGTINGLILYANIVNANGLVFFPPDGNTNIITNILTIFISWINLDLGIETCFYDGLNFYSYAWLNYIFPFYLWFLLGIIILISKISTKAAKLLGSNPVAVLATVILMSYMKLLQANIIALAYATLQYPQGNIKRMWFFDANVQYFEGKHIILSLAAICVIIFLLLPYFFLLMFGYHLQAYSNKKPFFWLNRFKPLLDAYYAPYKKNARYWTGFLLLVRTCLFLSFSFNIISNSSANLVAISSVFTAIALIPWLSGRIYEKFYNDILEASFILNICILSSATYHVRATGSNQAIVTYLSVGIAFLHFLGIVVFHMYYRLKAKDFLPHLKILKQKINFSSKPKKNDKPILQKTVSVTTVELRESLLED